MDALVLLCDPDGTILAFRVVGGGIGGVAPRRGMPFPALFGPGEMHRALDLFTALARHGAAVDWPIDVPRQPYDGDPAVHLSGVADAQGIALVAARRPGAAALAGAALAPTDPELAARLRPLAERAAPMAADQSRLFEEMAGLNSELATVQRALAKANADLAASNEQKNRLLGMLAHDLRTPLMVIAGFAQHLKERLGDRVDAGDLGCIDRIHESSLFMRHLIEDTLSLAAVQAGRLHLAKRPTDLGALVRRNVALNAVLARNKDIAIELAVADGLPAVPADPAKVEQVLNNLLSNAVKYSDPGSPVTVGVDRAGDALRIAVTDRGRGLHAAEAARLFQPFVRCAPSGTAGESSVGLGLFICRTIVEGHGGRIAVTSTPGAGSTFTVSLPLGDAAA